MELVVSHKIKQYNLTCCKLGSRKPKCCITFDSPIEFLTCKRYLLNMEHTIKLLC